MILFNLSRWEGLETGMETTIKTVGLAAVAAAMMAAVLAAQEPRGRLPGFAAQQYRLRNGLRVVLSEEDSLPLVSVVVAYGAGSALERPGQEGLAYLIENLMFQGSENVRPLQHITYVQKTGGELNANTTFDKSLFYETLPANQLALALWLESDRMKSLAITPEAFEKTRDRLLEANRRRLAAEPYLESFAAFDDLLYPDFVYGHPLISGGDDFRNLSEAEVKAFHDAYYVPNNAVLCIVGNIRAAKTRELVSRYFDAIPPGPDVPALPLPRFEPEEEVTRTVRELLLPSPALHIGYRFYPLQTGDIYALRVAEYLLLRGSSSRLYTRIVKKDRTALFLNGSLEERMGVRALKIFVTNNNDVMAERCLKAILSEVDKLRGNLVSSDELNKAKNALKMDYLERLSVGIERALLLTEAVFSGNPPESVLSELDRCLSVTPQTVISVVNRLFVPRNRVILKLETK
jgi:zinc protease